MDNLQLANDMLVCPTQKAVARCLQVMDFQSRMRLAVVRTSYCSTSSTSHSHPFPSKVNISSGHRQPNDELQWSVRVRPASARMTFSGTPTTKVPNRACLYAFAAKAWHLQESGAADFVIRLTVLRALAPRFAPRTAIFLRCVDSCTPRG